MKSLRRNIIICLVMLISATIFSSISFAGTGSPETPPGPPPHGLATQGDGVGAKLYGAITIEYRVLGAEGCNLAEYDSKIVLQLRKNNALMKTFVRRACLRKADPEVQQIQIMNSMGKDSMGNEISMKDEILDYFFGDRSLTITLISIDIEVTPEGQWELEDVMVPVPKTGECGDPGGDASPCHDEFMMADIAIAVK